MTDAQDLPPVLDEAIEAAQRIVTDFDIRLPRAFDAFVVARALLSRRSERDAVLEEAAKLLDLRRQDILLIAGEMTAQEIRSVRAMLNERARAIRALKAEGSNPSSPSEASPTRRNPNDER